MIQKARINGHKRILGKKQHRKYNKQLKRNKEWKDQKV